VPEGPDPDPDSDPELELPASREALFAGGDSLRSGLLAGERDAGEALLGWGLGLGGGDADLRGEPLVPDLEELLWEPELELDPDREDDLDAEELPELGLLKGVKSVNYCSLINRY